jgi:hypothetical protein
MEGRVFRFQRKFVGLVEDAAAVGQGRN